MSDISSLKGKTTRFAPSVTGYLHLGHLYHLLILEKLHRDAGVKVLVRLEDHDTNRSRPDYEVVILELLEWFGFDFFKDSPTFIRQSDRGPLYDDYFLKIPAACKFKCTCTKSRLKDLERNEWFEYHYDGHCLRTPVLDEKFGWRVLYQDHVVAADDFLLGPIQQNPYQQVHSSILKNHLTQWSYQFSVVVDDISQGIDLVVRGEDVMHTTGRYLQIAEMLGAEHHPVFMHHPLIYDGQKTKLSKRHGSDAIHTWRSEGQSQEQIIAKLYSSLNADFKKDKLSLDDFLNMLTL